MDGYDPVAAKEDHILRLMQKAEDKVVVARDNTTAMCLTTHKRRFYPKGSEFQVQSVREQMIYCFDEYNVPVVIANHQRLNLILKEDEPKKEPQPLKGPERKMEFDDDSY